jgi:hypothetical protein
MTTRRKKGIRLGAYDYLAAHFVVVNALKDRGEPFHMTPTEMSMVTTMTEVCAERGMNLDRAMPHLLEVVDEIVRARKAVLFPVFDIHENMGDDSCAPAHLRPALTQADGVAA